MQLAEALISELATLIGSLDNADFEGYDNAICLSIQMARGCDEQEAAYCASQLLLQEMSA